MYMRHAVASLALAALVAAPVGAAQARQQSPDAAYMKLIRRAAPPQVVRNATIVRMDDGKMQTLKQGTNGFTCMTLKDGTPMCADANAMAWGQARLDHKPPPDTIGFIYMLAGDHGTSNTDPYATKPEPGNHWVQDGPHVMIVGGAVKEMIAGYPATPDPNIKEPYVMWPGTPYQHLMLPVSRR